jgi:hypothetical protein
MCSWREWSPLFCLSLLDGVIVVSCSMEVASGNQSGGGDGGGCTGGGSVGAGGSGVSGGG